MNETVEPSEAGDELCETQESVQEPKERPGAILKREREAQGIPLDVVHEATKIPMDALRAIEEGYEIRMLSPFYYKGFLKMYAEYLGLDAAGVIDDYREEELPEHTELVVDEFELPSWITKMFTRRRKQQIVVVAAGLLALFLVVKVLGFIAGLFRNRPAPKPSVTAAQKAPAKPSSGETVKKAAGEANTLTRQVPAKIDVPKTIPKVEPKVQPAPAPQTVHSAPPPAPAAATVPAVVALIRKEINLTVRARQNCWLRVKEDGTTVFQSTLRTGAVETWTADKEIEISGKNITQLEFELNGKMIGALGRKDRNAKKVVITKNGLSVKN